MIALALVSAAALAHEVALVHLFSIVHWSHFATLVIALALLGFGASGSAVAVTARRGGLAGRERSAFVVATALAALTFYPTVRLAMTIPFDAFELIAVPRQVLYLALTWIVLGTPFFFAGAAVTLAFLTDRDRIGRVYAANLAGSGAGSLLGLALVATLPAGRLPAVVGGIAGLAQCRNVRVKLGGVGSLRSGHDWHQRPAKPSSLELAQILRPYFEHCIESFGVDRCMFESNFPVEKASNSYANLWNAFKRITERYTPSERSALFHDTAARVYRIEN